MNLTTRTARFAGFTLAVLLTGTIHGTMLSSFDAVAQEANLTAACPASTVVRLEQVSIVAPRS
jgi:hypothetical protein